MVSAWATWPTPVPSVSRARSEPLPCPSSPPRSAIHRGRGWQPAGQQPNLYRFGGRSFSTGSRATRICRASVRAVCVTRLEYLHDNTAAPHTHLGQESGRWVVVPGQMGCPGADGPHSVALASISGEGRAHAGRDCSLCGCVADLLGALQAQVGVGPWCLVDGVLSCRLDCYGDHRCGSHPLSAQPRRVIRCDGWFALRPSH